MPPIKSSAKLSRTVPAVLLVMALLCMQWAGLLHSITHAGWQQEHTRTVSASISFTAVDSSKENLPHSCALFDAATLADIVHTVPSIAPLLTSVQVLALWSAFASWDAPVIHHFSPRAPPPA